MAEGGRGGFLAKGIIPLSYFLFFSAYIYIYTSPLNGEAAFDFPRGRSTGLLNIQSANFVGPPVLYLPSFVSTKERKREREKERTKRVL